MVRIWIKFYCDTKGATSIEYAMIASLISVAIIGGVTAVGFTAGGNMDMVFRSVEDSM